MKVIVNVAGFYGGTWYDSGAREQEIADRVAKSFLPPYGDQLSPAPEKKPAPAPVEPKSSGKQTN